jgi:hypothetical protein
VGARDHRQGLNTLDGRVEREQAGLDDWFVTVIITEGELPLSV